MKFLSTRGGIAPVGFKDAVMMGLATDGGLLLPENIPVITTDELKVWQDLSFADLSFAVISKFATDIPADDLNDIIQQSYKTFNHPAVTPLVARGGVHILELFHGPTLAFKDVALQFLGNIFAYLLKERNQKMNILGATSGDTGSAAIYGVRGKERINIFIIHPHKRVSPIQEKQMTTVLDDNVFNIAIDGSFDDGQALVKSIFNDLAFKDKYHLGAINSINWARIVAQVVYYVYAALQLQKEEQKVDFSVPTGNFGDIFAGYIAREMLSSHIGQLILATNENDLLARFVNDGDYSLGEVSQTCSPSMDIQIASNFERYLYFLNKKDSSKTKQDMECFAKDGKLQFTKEQQQEIKKSFQALAVDELATKKMIKDFYDDSGYILDPHTAVGVKAGLQYKGANPMVCLATAHPAKFEQAVTEAIGQVSEQPASFVDLLDRQSKCELMAADKEQVMTYIEKNGL